MSCGQPAEYLVTWPYAQGSQSAQGRLLVYCSECRSKKASVLGLVVPLSLIELAGIDDALCLMYESGYTRTDPGAARDVLELPYGRWFTVAQRAMSNAERPGGDDTTD